MFYHGVLDRKVYGQSVPHKCRVINYGMQYIKFIENIPAGDATFLDV